MRVLRNAHTYFLSIALIFVSCSVNGIAQTDHVAKTQVAVERHDGQHDFDFEIGTWKTHLRRLLHPLSGSAQWVECEGTTVVRKIWEGRANLVELEADCPSGHFEGLSLRLYNPESRQWSLNFANSGSGSLSQPTIGEFRNGRGEFFDQEPYHGRAILVRFVISDTTRDSCRFEQSFSDDGGKTWEVNWTAVDTRVADEVPKSIGQPSSQQQRQNDFDFQVGLWKPQISRLQHPLTGTTTWTQYDGRQSLERCGTAAPISFSLRPMARLDTSRFSASACTSRKPTSGALTTRTAAMASSLPQYWVSLGRGKASFTDATN